MYICMYAHFCNSFIFLCNILVHCCLYIGLASICSRALAATVWNPSDTLLLGCMAEYFSYPAARLPWQWGSELAG